MKNRLASALMTASVIATVGFLAAPSAFADEGPSKAPLDEYTCTSSHSGNTGSAKCVDLSRLDSYRAKVTCTDSRGIKSVFHGPWRGGHSGEWSSFTCPVNSFFYKAGYEVELA